MSDYNGWTNRETWLINLHFEPRTEADLENIKAALEEQEETLPPFFRDYVDLSLINWEELASYSDPEQEKGDE